MDCGGEDGGRVVAYVGLDFLDDEAKYHFEDAAARPCGAPVSHVAFPDPSDIAIIRQILLDACWTPTT